MKVPNHTVDLAQESVEKVIILMTDCHIGNLVVSLPAMVALQQRYSAIPHYFVIDEAFIELVETIIEPAHTWIYPRNRIKSGNPLRRAQAYFGFIHKLRSFRAELLVDLVGSRNTGILARASGARLRLGSSRALRPKLYTHRAKLSPDTHKVYHYTNIAAATGAEIRHDPFRYAPSPRKLASLRTQLKAEHIAPNQPVVSIHIGAGRIQKLWNISGFVEVSDWLTGHGYQVAFVGAPSELDRAQQVISQLARPVANFVGKLSLGELMALLKMSTAYLGNDSGPMHIAAAMGTPGIGMFSYASRNLWGPRSNQITVLRGRDVCEICITKRCCHPLCITDLKSTTVIHELGRILGVPDNPV